ncbi:MAG TPA: hypothetical protein VG603_07740, partial [Chitinophagales bacterium]|nr:hypothetical protein [Chitinophagales bacterium]
AKRSNTDLTVFKTSGIVTQLPDGEYMFGDSLKIKQNNLRGNVIKYNDKTGFIKAEGKFDLGTNFGIIKTAAAGSAETLLDSGKYKLNLTFAIDPRMNDKMQERFEFYMVNDNADQPDINYDNDKSRKAITELCDEKDDKKTLDDFIKTAAFNKRPKDLDENIVFTDVNFVFDPDDISLRSVGKIGVAMVGKKVVNKKLDGYIELQYKGGADIFTIYIQTGTKGWFYFNYRPGTLAVISSYSDLNNQLIAVPADKRKIKGEKNRFYVYAPGSPLDEQDFVDYMKDRANGVSRPHPEMHAPTEEIPMAGDTSGLNEMPGDTGVAPVNQQQEEINQIQDMKGTSGGILSGPPPDRVKPAEQNTDTVKTQEQMQEQKQQDEINNVEQMKGAGDGGILSGPPPDRNKPNVDTTASQAPAQQTPQPDTTVASPKDEIKQEPPKQVAAPTVTPPVQQPAKQDSVAPAPKEEIKSETPKSDVTPSAAEPAKQDAPAATQQTPPVAEPPAEAPKADTTQPKPASDSIPVGQPH